MRGDVLNIENLFIGRIDYGYKRPVRVTLDLQIGTREGLFATTGHAEARLGRRVHAVVSNPLSFSMSGGIWNTRLTHMLAAGQMCEEFRDLVSYAPGFTSASVNRLVDLWEEWHLNDLTGCCDEQGYSYSIETRRLHLGATAPCPQTGYRAGHAWLVRPLPAGFADEVRSLLPLA